MRRGRYRKEALAGVAAAIALLLAYIGLSFAAPAHALSPTAILTDTEPAPDPQPAPDPAPAPAPKPKPVSKPAPAPVHHSPAPVYHAPVPSSTPSSTPTYTPPKTHVTHRAHKKKHVVHRRKHVQPKTHPVSTPKPVKDVSAPIPRVQIGAKTAAVTSAGDSLRPLVVITGLAVAALLFLLVTTVPATDVRFTGPGRVIMAHQTDLVLAGVATLLLTAMLFLVTGGV